MRTSILAALSLGVAACCGSAHAAITIVKNNGDPVPATAYTKTFNSKTGGWDITLLQLYNPGLDSVFEIRGDAGETIDNLLIPVNGPAAGSPLIVRVLGVAPGGLASIHNISQTGNAEVILNRVDVSLDIGSVQVQAIGELFAGRDILGPVAATTPISTVRGITTARAVRHVLGDVTADNGRIGLVWAQTGNIGTPAAPITIRARHHILQVMGSEVYANINSRFGGGGAGGFWALVADRFSGTLTTEQLIPNTFNGVDGLILIHDHFDGAITIGKSFTSSTQYIQVPTHGLNGQIIINADNAPGGAWSAPVRVGPNGDSQQIVLNEPNYTVNPSLVGSGSVGLVPFTLYDAACTPTNGGSVERAPTAPPVSIALRHYGPVTYKKGKPVLIERRPAGSTGAFQPVPSSDFTMTRSALDARTITLTAAAGKPGFQAGFQYRIQPAAALRCDVPAQPAVTWTGPYLFTVLLPPCDGDINRDAAVNVNDLLLLIAVWGSNGSVLPAADMNADGIVNVNDLLILIGNWGACWD